MADRKNCCFYVPWIALISWCVVIAGSGCWIYYSIRAWDKSQDALDYLDIDVPTYSHTEPILIATAVTYLVIVVAMLAISIARGPTEAKHDRGESHGGATALLVFNAFFNLLWYILVVWGVFVICADALWILLAYVGREMTKYYANQPVPVTVPVGNYCPGECLNLGAFPFVDDQANTLCVCDKTALQNASNAFNDTIERLYGVEAGVWIMWIGATWLLINVACQFSRTSAERDYLEKSGKKQFAAA